MRPYVLSGKAAEQWALIKKSLALHGKDVKDFELFKAELLANFVDMSVEDTVRYRLAQLKQAGTVAQYYSAFSNYSRGGHISSNWA
jgi:hypothetical protein